MQPVRNLVQTNALRTQMNVGAHEDSKAAEYLPRPRAARAEPISGSSTQYRTLCTSEADTGSMDSTPRSPERLGHLALTGH